MFQGNPPRRWQNCQAPFVLVKYCFLRQIDRNFVLDLENGTIVHPSRQFGIIPYSAAQGLSGLCALLRLFARGLSNVRQSQTAPDRSSAVIAADVMVTPSEKSAPRPPLVNVSMSPPTNTRPLRIIRIDARTFKNSLISDLGTVHEQSIVQFSQSLGSGYAARGGDLGKKRLDCWAALSKQRA